MVVYTLHFAPPGQLGTSPIHYTPFIHDLLGRLVPLHSSPLLSPSSTLVFVSPRMPSSKQSGLWTNRPPFLQWSHSPPLPRDLSGHYKQPPDDKADKAPSLPAWTLTDLTQNSTGKDGNECNCLKDAFVIRFLGVNDVHFFQVNENHFRSTQWLQYNFSNDKHVHFLEHKDKHVKVTFSSEISWSHYEGKKSLIKSMKMVKRSHLMAII